MVKPKRVQVATNYIWLYYQVWVCNLILLLFFEEWFTQKMMKAQDLMPCHKQKTVSRLQIKHSIRLTPWKKRNTESKAHSQPCFVHLSGQPCRQEKSEKSPDLRWRISKPAGFEVARMSRVPERRRNVQEDRSSQVCGWRSPWNYGSTNPIHGE